MQERKCTVCNEQYSPTNPRDNVCPDCRQWHALAYKEKDAMKVERIRALYNAEHKPYLSYGKFVALLDRVERGRKNELAKGSD